jgi:hypothetical protein
VNTAPTPKTNKKPKNGAAAAGILHAGLFVFYTEQNHLPPQDLDLVGFTIVPKVTAPLSIR